MDRNLIIAATVSAALHGGIFLHRDRKAPPPREAVPAMKLSDPFQMPVMPEDPPEVEYAPPSEAKGSPEPMSPRSADTPVADPGPFPMPTTDVPVAVKIEKIGVIQNLPPGTLDGVEGGKDLLARLIDLDNTPRTRTQVAPVYPYEAKASGRTGEVFVEFTVDESGRVLDPRVVRSSDRVFEEPTLRAVLKWRFEPGRLHGKVVRFRMAVPVQFNLNGD
jgi:periplasmic protein TonB